MRKIFIPMIAAIMLCSCGDKNYIVTSPDGSITANIFLQNDSLFYSVDRNGVAVIERSPLGFTADAGDYAGDVSIVDATPVVTISKSYDLPMGKKSHVDYTANEMVVNMKNGKKSPYAVVFRVSDDGVAFAYDIKGEGEMTITSEATGYKFPTGSKAFITPLSKAKSGWAATNPSYEEHYVCNADLGVASKDGQGWTYPALFTTPDENWILISETGVDANYVGTYLAEEVIDNTYTVGFPHADQNLAEDPTSATFSLPMRTPWRTITLGTLPTVVESTMAQDLVEPLYAAKSEYIPGLSSWSWLVLKDNNVSYPVIREFIDMSADQGFKYCLIDNWWDNNIGKEKVEQLAKYAEEKGVGLILWYNSNGEWNDAPQTPQDKMHLADARRAEMEWMRSIGIKGIKVDFFGGDKQRVMKLYDDILRDANDYGIGVNFHGTTLPRGWDIMYPNFITNEAVMGMEFITFDQGNADKQPEHCATLPFTRNVVAPMDFTPLILNKRLGDRPNTGPERRTTAAFELALPVIFYSPIQHLGLVPDNVKEFPEFVWSYLRYLPTVWDETKLLAGYPGEYVAMARRKGDVWYVAGINGTSSPREVEVDLSFIGGDIAATIIGTSEDDKNAVNQVAFDIPASKHKVTLGANDGMIMVAKRK